MKERKRVELFGLQHERHFFAIGFPFITMSYYDLGVNSDVKNDGQKHMTTTLHY